MTDILPKITRDKILQNTRNSTEFYDIAAPHKVLPELHVRVYPQLERVDFYEGHSIPEFDYVPASLQARRNFKADICELSNLLDDFHQGQLTFIGQAGSGKSTLLKAIARDVIAGKYESLKDVDVVHFIQCQNLHQGNKDTLGGLLFQSNNPELTKEEIKQTLEFAMANPKRILFILDSLDTLSYTIDGVYEQLHVSDCASPEAVLWNFLAGKLLPCCRIITSSREHSIRHYKGEVRAQEVIALVGLSMDSIRKIIDGYVGEEEAEELMKYMEQKSPTLLDLSATPVFLKFNLIGLKCECHFKPSTMPGVLVLLLNSLIRSPHTHVEDILEVIDKLKQLSFTGTKERRVVFSTDELTCFGLKPKAVTDLAILAPGVLTQRLLLGSYLMFFAHQSIQELLAAMYIAQMPRELYLNFLRDNIHTAHYAVVRRILCGLLLNDEVKDQAAQYFQGNRNMEENGNLLHQNLQEQLSLAMDKADKLQLYLSLSEVKKGMKEAIRSSVMEIDLSNVPLSPSDAEAVGWVASNCEQLSKLKLWSCHLTPASVKALALNLRDCDLKLSTLSLWGNTTMEEAGFKIVGKISKQCGVEELDLRSCMLSSQELQALKEGLNSAKVSSLDLSYNTIMGVAGLKSVGEIARQSRVEKLHLGECKLSLQKLRSLKEGLDSAKLRTLILWEDKTASHEDVLVFSELIQNVTELLNVTLWGINKEDESYLQQHLDRCYPTQLKIRTDSGYLSTNRPLEPEQSPVTEKKDKKKEGEVEEEEHGEKEKGVKPSKVWTGKITTGGIELEIAGCSISFPDGAFDETTDVRVKVEIDRSKWPTEYVGITPMLYVESSRPLQKPASVRMASWCMNGDEGKTAEVHVLHRPRGSHTWDIIARLPFEDGAIFHFETQDFSPIFVGILEWLFGPQIFLLDGYIYATFQNIITFAFCLRHELIKNELEKDLEESKKLLVIDPVDTKKGDEIQLLVECCSPTQLQPNPQQHSFVVDDAFIELRRKITRRSQILNKAPCSPTIQMKCSICKNHDVIDDNMFFTYYESSLKSNARMTYYADRCDVQVTGTCASDEQASMSGTSRICTPREPPAWHNDAQADPQDDRTPTVNVIAAQNVLLGDSQMIFCADRGDTHVTAMVPTTPPCKRRHSDTESE